MCGRCGGGVCRDRRAWEGVVARRLWWAAPPESVVWVGRLGLARKLGRGGPGAVCLGGAPRLLRPKGGGDGSCAARREACVSAEIARCVGRKGEAPSRLVLWAFRREGWLKCCPVRVCVVKVAACLTR